MNSESYYIGALVKFAFCGGTASVLLWFWKRRGIKSILLFFLSCANLVCFVVWLAINGAVYAMAKSPNLRPMIYNGSSAVMAALFTITFLWPYVATVAAFILFALSYAAQPGEHKFLVPANLLMLVSWASTIVALN
jgi:hypothetical protein